MLTFILWFAFAITHYPSRWMRQMYSSIKWRVRACWAFTATFTRFLMTAR